MLTTAAWAGGLAFLAVAFGVSALGYLLLERDSGDRRRTLGRLRELSGQAPAPADEPSETVSLKWLASRLGSLASSREKNRLEELKTKLLYAGYTQDSAPSYYIGLRLMLVVSLMLSVGVGAAFVAGMAWQKVVLWSVAAGVAGFIIPSFVLSSHLNKRQATIRASLPDALDIMVMCVESGASLNAAIQCVADELDVHPILNAELVVIQREMQLGLSAGEAFRSFADRSGVTEVRDLAAVLTQSERYGASVAKALKSYADQARQERQMWSEEMANKAAVKIVFPTLLCIFPAMFIVLLGPAATQMSRLFAR